FAAVGWRAAPAAGRHRLDQPHVPADHGIGTDHGLATEDGGARVDRHVILDGGMALRAPSESRIALEAERAERDALVYLDVVPDHGRLADHHAGPVVDEERFSDGRSRVDV